mmetsp:Transcript_13203/g.39995  ORF Transcript_13203/g.39995 Transcript_13203/m.39995 type:complete len:675 (+) Transcript_13203:610-2634(+)
MQKAGQSAQLDTQKAQEVHVPQTAAASSVHKSRTASQPQTKSQARQGVRLQRPRQARLDGGAVLKPLPARSTKGPVARSAAQPSQAATQDAQSPACTDGLLRQHSRDDGRGRSGEISGGDGVAQTTAGKTGGGNAFAAMMTAQRELSQTHQFFLERDPSGSWHWYWWLKVPGQAAPGQAASGQGQPAAQSSPGQVGTQEQSPSTRHIDSNATQPPSLSQPSGARPSSRGVWSAVTQVAFEPGSKSVVKLLTNVGAIGTGPNPEGPEMGWSTPGLASNGSGARWHGSTAPLKSALQKNIRLCRAHAAVRVAMYLIKENATEFLRRFAVIVAEDTVVHPAYPALAWLLVAHAKGLPLRNTHVNLLLTMVQQVAAVPVRDALPPCPHSGGGSQNDWGSTPAQGTVASQHQQLLRRRASGHADVAQTGGPGHADVAQGGEPDGEGCAVEDAIGGPPTSDAALAVIDAAVVSAEAAAIVKALRLRASYGGMQGDQAMMRRYADLWQARFAGTEGCAPPLPAPPGTFVSPGAPQLLRGGRVFGEEAGASWLRYMHQVHELNCGEPVDCTSVGPLQRGDIPLSTVDFHCSTISDDLQQEDAIKAAAAAAIEADQEGLLDGIDDAFRSAMWLFRSGLNRRVPISGRGAPLPGPKERLLDPLWAVSAAPVDAWSQTFIRKRFY